MAASIVRQGSYGNYPAPPGDKLTQMTLINGPASYTAITTGTPPTNGWLVTAKDLGLNAIEFVFIAVSDNGQYELVPMPAKSQNAPQSSIRFMIRTAATGAEISTTDLSARSFLICAIGTY